MSKSIESYRTLLNQLSDTLIEENIAMRDSIQRIDSLLKHMISLLDESFFNEDFGNMNAMKSNNIEQINRKALSNTTRVLQVEDIVSQIIYLEVNRSIEIDKTLNNIKLLANDNDVSTQELLQIIDQIKLFQISRKNPTDQISLDPGDIELF